MCILFLGECAILVHPADQLDVVAGSDVTFSVTLTRPVESTDDFRWFFDNTPIPDTSTRHSGLGTPELTVVGANSGDEGEYTVYVFTSDGFNPSNGAQLQLFVCKCSYLTPRIL